MGRQGSGKDYRTSRKIIGSRKSWAVRRRDSATNLESAASLGMKPYEEQWEAAELMSAPEVRRFALFWKPGSGKTGAMITAAHELLSRGVVKGVLVVAERPLAMQTPWAAELARWLPSGHDENKVAAVTGTRKQRFATYQSNPRWVIVHYGNLDADQYPIRSWAQRNEGVERPIVIFDESDLIKNPAAQRSIAAMAVRQECGRCWIASGTPAPNSPLRLRTSALRSVRIPCGHTING